MKVRRRKRKIKKWTWVHVKYQSQEVNVLGKTGCVVCTRHDPHICHMP